MFCFQHEPGVRPDVLILGKALSGGAYPVSAVVASREVLGVFRPGDHGSTFGGNPLGSAIGVAALGVLVGEKLPKKSEAMGKYFMEKLRAIRSPARKRSSRRMGLMDQSVRCVPSRWRESAFFCEKLAKLGVLAKDTHDQVIRFTPPLVIKKAEIDWAVKRIEAVLEE